MVISPQPVPRRSSGARRVDAPTVSIVVISTQPVAQLRECVAALVPQCERIMAQLIVVREAPHADLVALSQTMPTAHIVEAPSPSTPRDLRALGMAQAAGDIVSFVTDDKVPDSSWVLSLVRHGTRAL